MSDATAEVEKNAVIKSGKDSSKTGKPGTRSIHFSEDLSVGDTWTTELRRITSKDVQEFSNLTGDHTPLHGQSGSCSPFGKPVAHGLLGLSILAGLGSNHPNASTLALVGIEDWQFLAPVFIGDKVSARNEIVLIEPHGRRAVKVRWLRQLMNEAGRAVQQGYFVTLVGSRRRSVAKPR
jgi:acyl dehydratase